MTGFDSKRDMAVDKLQEPEREALKFLTMTDKELIETASKQVQALRMALDMIECEKYERRHVRWAIVDALKEAALAQPAQEPVATVKSVATVVSESGNQEVTMSWWHEPALPVGTKLYTAPPQREWVGLTGEDCKGMSAGDKVVAMWANRILKEKNA